MATLTQKFGQYVSRRRKEKGISQAELSNKVFNAPNQAYISELETGLRENINLNTVEKILDILDTEIKFVNRE